MATSPCIECGEPGTGRFCAKCGAAQSGPAPEASSVEATNPEGVTHQADTYQAGDAPPDDDLAIDEPAGEDPEPDALQESRTVTSQPVRQRWENVAPLDSSSLSPTDDATVLGHSPAARPVPGAGSPAGHGPGSYPPGAAISGPYSSGQLTPYGMVPIVVAPQPRSNAVPIMAAVLAAALGSGATWWWFSSSHETPTTVATAAVATTPTAPAPEATRTTQFPAPVPTPIQRPDRSAAPDPQPGTIASIVDPAPPRTTGKRIDLGAQPPPSDQPSAVASNGGGLAELNRQRLSDSFGLRLAGQWVPQLASKYDGARDPLQQTASGSHVFGSDDIWAEHMQLRDALGSVRLVRSDDIRTKARAGTWITFYDDDFSSASQVKAWCRSAYPTLSGNKLVNRCTPRHLNKP